MRKSFALAATAVAVLGLAGATPVFAHGGGGTTASAAGTAASSVQLSHGDSSKPDLARNYINSDDGVNPNVDRDSECRTPDRFDVQRLSPRGKTTKNVHIDACLFDRYRDDGRQKLRKVDGRVTWQSFGVGEVFSCPDPDDGGPKTAVTRDSDRDGDLDMCLQSGYQEKGIAGDREFHVRVNNDSKRGTQSVVFCYDRDRNGCLDEDIKDVAVVKWVRR